MEGQGGTVSDSGYGGNWVLFNRLTGINAQVGSVLNINRTGANPTSLAMVRLNGTVIIDANAALSSLADKRHDYLQKYQELNARLIRLERFSPET